MRLARLPAALCAAALALTGCAALQPRTEQDLVARDDGEAADVAVGGVLRVAIERPSTIDPARIHEPGAELLASVVCDTLVALDPESAEPRPALSRASISTSAGVATVFSLRKGVRFHEGSQLDSFDVARSWSRASRQEVASPTADVLSGIDGWVDTHTNLDAPTDRLEDERRDLAGVAVSSRDSLMVTMEPDRADGLFSRLVTHPVTTPMPGDTSDEVADLPVCAGPFRVVAPYREGDDVIAVERFDDYHRQHGAYTNGGAGYFDRIEFHLYDDEEAGFAAFELGQVDLAAIPPDRLSEVMASGTTRVVRGVDPRLEMIGLPEAVVADRSVRTALSLAIDRRAIARDVYGDGMVAATGFYPPAVGRAFDALGCATVQADPAPDLARALMADATQGLEGPLPLFFNDEHRNRALVESVAAQWEAVLGLTVEPIAVPWDEYRRRARSSAGMPGAFRVSWDPSIARATDYLEPLFGSGSVGVDNWTRYSSVHLDRAIASAKAADADHLQLPSLTMAELLLCHDLPAIPLLWGQSEYAVAPGIESATGAWVDVTTGLPILRELHRQR